MTRSEEFSHGMTRPEDVPTDYTFDVDYADDKDALKRGEIASGTHRVTVRSHSHTDAMRTANEMLFARGKEPTRARLVNVRV
jgi:hypothetical protein